MSNVTIDRAENVIINKGGKAHCTGWVLLGFHGSNGAPRLARGTGGYDQAKGCYVVDSGAPEIPVSVPLSVADFERLTGWAPEA